MGKKIWYSTPLKMFWNEVIPTQKKITPNYSDEEIYRSLVYQNTTAPIIPPETKLERENFRMGLDLWWDDYNKRFLHIFFIDSNLRSILQEISLKDLAGIKQYFYDNGIKKTVIYENTRQKMNYVSYSFGIHIPYETEGYAFQINIYENNVFELFFVQNGIYGILTETMLQNLLNKKDEDSEMYKKTFKFAVNTIAYMQIFKDCIIDGVPRITVERNEKRTTNNKTLAISKYLEDKETKGTITPHKRNWYIKYLRSDFYTKKKGQLILVRETMVNGIAKTFYTASDINENSELGVKET